MLKKFFSVTALLAISANIAAHDYIELAQIAPEAAVVETTAVAPVIPSYAEQIRTYAAQKQQAVAAFAGKATASVCNTVSQANQAVDTAALTRMPWFKNHANALTASKVAIATAVIAVTGYMLKKAYNKFQAYKAAKAVQK